MEECFWGINIHPRVNVHHLHLQVGSVLRHLQLWIDLWVGIVWIAPAVHLMVLLHSCQSKAGTNVRLNLVQHLFPSSFLAKYKSKHCAQCSLPSFQVQLCGRFLHQWPLSWENLYKYFDKMQASQWHCEASLRPWYGLAIHRLTIDLTNSKEQQKSLITEDREVSLIKRSAQRRNEPSKRHLNWGLCSSHHREHWMAPPGAIEWGGMGQ